MIDLEITRLCAEAMGITLIYGDCNAATRHRYEPLTNDEQAMALVKRFKPIITFAGGAWGVSADSMSVNTNLNRAICECVARMQANSAT